MQLKQLETNIVYHGDCLDVMKSIPDKSIDLILTDPPYGINYISQFADCYDYIQNDKLNEWQELMPLWLKEMVRILTDTGCCLCFCAGGGKTPVTAIFTSEAINYFNLIQTLVWRKAMGLGWKYRPAYENIVVLSKSKDNYSFYDTSKKCSNVIEGINKIVPNSEMHPTQKPIELMAHLIKIHSKENDIVLDPFSGSGSTALACIKLNRRYIGIELNEKYYKMSLERIKRENQQLKLFSGAL